MKWFSWEMIAVDLSNHDVLRIKDIYETDLQTIFDYLSVVHMENKVEKIKNNKSIV